MQKMGARNAPERIILLKMILNLERASFKEIAVSMDKNKLRRIVREVLTEMASLGGPGLKEMPMFDEEVAAAGHINSLAELYKELQKSPHTSEVAAMEDAFRETVWKIKSGEMRQGDVYSLVGMAAALKALGLRGHPHASLDADEGEGL